MKFSTSTSLALLSLAGSSSADYIGSYPGPGGQKKLLGSSFGAYGTNAAFDYVIVGGGTSGNTVGSRLAAAGYSVAIVEAGSFYEISNSNTSQIPAFAIQGTSANPSDPIFPLVDWADITAPQSGLAGRTLHYPQGKGFGGSSARNLIVYQRGTVGAYQQWANQVQDNSFTFANLLQYFKQSPQFTPPNYSARGPNSQVSYDPSAFSPNGGPLQVSYPNFFPALSTYLQKAYTACGLPSIPGFNSGKMIGWAEIATTAIPSSQTRSTSENSFLQNADYATNIQEYQLTLAEKVLFTGTQATGVQVNTAGTRYTLSANKEVILAAGAFRSPQLLMLSGIGPSSTLSSFGITPVSVLPGVGQNLWDQPFFGLTYKTNVTTQSQLQSNPSYYAQAVASYQNNNNGPLAFVGGNIVGFEKVPQSLRKNFTASTQSDLATFPSDWPELEILPVGSAEGPVPDATANYFAINMALLAPLSRGSVTINSTNPADPPVINPNYLTSTTDQQVAIAAFKRARQIAAATGVQVGDEVFPGPAVQTDAQILAYIQQDAGPIWHASATNAMGPVGNPNTVVDTKGRVQGVSNLRVVDASTFPFLPPGHCQATVYALAEKYAQAIINGS